MLFGLEGSATREALLQLKIDNVIDFANGGQRAKKVKLDTTDCKPLSAGCLLSKTQTCDDLILLPDSF